MLLLNLYIIVFFKIVNLVFIGISMLFFGKLFLNIFWIIFDLEKLLINIIDFICKFFFWMIDVIKFIVFLYIIWKYFKKYLFLIMSFLNFVFIIFCKLVFCIVFLRYLSFFFVCISDGGVFIIIEWFLILEIFFLVIFIFWVKLKKLIILFL